jgi:hypothetical protein
MSIPQPAAAALLAGQEPVKPLAWRTDHRGPLLIHAAKRERGKGSEGPATGAVCNAVIGVVDLADCVADDAPPRRDVAALQVESWRGGEPNSRRRSAVSAS